MVHFLMSYKYSKSKTSVLGTETFMNKVSTGLLTASIVSAESKILGRVTTSSSYSVNHSMYFIGADTLNATGSVNIRLPSASGSVSGRAYVIKDETGAADVNNVIIQVSNSDTIDGTNQLIIESPYASINLYTDGISRWFIY